MMALYEITDDGLAARPRCRFSDLGILERQDLQAYIRDDISVLGDDLLVIAEEFGDWEGARRRIDLLAIDRSGRLVVIELKRTDDGGHMDLQALRYAAMVSSMTFEQVVSTYENHIAATTKGRGVDAHEALMNFLVDVDDGDQPAVSTDVRIILVSADFGREITTTVLWLNGFEGMDIRCVRMVPYQIADKILIDVQHTVPLPEAADYQVQIRRKEAAQLRSRTAADGRDFTRYQVMVNQVETPPAPKRQAIRTLIEALHAWGADMFEVRRCLPKQRRLRPLDGILRTEDEIVAALEADGLVGLDRWFTGHPMVDEANGVTWVLHKMWGTDTESAMSALVQRFPDAGISFHAAEVSG